MVIWLVGLVGMKSIELSPRVTIDKVSLVWHFLIFSISNFWVGRAGLQTIGWSITKRLNSMWGCKSDLHTKFQLYRTKIDKVIFE